MSENQDVAVVEEKVSPEIQNNETSQENQETQEQINWKKFREQRERERKEKEAAQKAVEEERKKAEALQAALESVLNKNQPQGHLQTNYDENHEPADDIKKHVYEILEAEKRKAEEERIRKEQAELPNRLAQVYPDINTVCSSENLDYLEYHHPQLAKLLGQLPEGFDKYAQIYQTVKRYVPNVDSKRDEKKAEQNLQKPKSISIPGMAPVGDHAPHQLTDAQKSANWARMQKRMKGLL